MCLVPLFVAWGQAELALVLGRLDAEGFFVIAKDRHLASLQNDCIALGGTVLLVPEDQLAEAEALLDDAGPMVERRLSVALKTLFAIMFLWAPFVAPPMAGGSLMRMQREAMAQQS